MKVAEVIRMCPSHTGSVTPRRKTLTGIFVGLAFQRQKATLLLNATAEAGLHIAPKH